MKKIQKIDFLKKSKNAFLLIFKVFVLLCFWYYHKWQNRAKPDFSGVWLTFSLFIVRFTHFWLFLIFLIFTIFTFFHFLNFWSFFQIKRTWKSQVLSACLDIVFSYRRSIYLCLCITLNYYSENPVNDSDKSAMLAPLWSTCPYSLEVNTTINGKSPAAFLIAT